MPGTALGATNRQEAKGKHRGLALQKLRVRGWEGEADRSRNGWPRAGGEGAVTES